MPTDAPSADHRAAGQGRVAAWTRFAAVLTSLVLVVAVLFPASADAAEAPVALGTAASFSVLGGQTVTNTGTTQLGGDLGLSPGTSITGAPGVLGTTHIADAVALQAKSDLTVAYNSAADRPASEPLIAGDLVGRTLVGGVYRSTSTLDLSGTLTLDAQGDPTAVFIFQIASTFISASGSKIVLINSAQPCNVFWQVGSSATLGTGSAFVGTIMALTSITVTTGVSVEGRALAREGSVTLDNNTFTTPRCDLTPPTTTTSTTTTVPGATTTTTVGGTTTTVGGTTSTSTTTTAPGATTTTVGGTTSTTVPGASTTPVPVEVEGIVVFATTTTGQVLASTSSGRGPDGSPLAFTGGNAVRLLTISFVLMLGGAAIVLGVRRRGARSQ